MKHKFRQKKTLEKYYMIAEQMRISGNYTLDIHEFKPEEVLTIVTLAQNDAIFNFVKEIKDMDVRVLYSTMKYLDAKEEMSFAKSTVSCK